MGDLHGIRVLITGSTSGLGLHTAKKLFSKGATVIITCRDEVRGRRALEQIVGPSDGDDALKQHSRAHLYSLDLSSYVSIVNFTEELKRDFEQLDVIINNAGIMGLPFELSSDGIEMHVATNAFGHYVLVQRLLPLLAASQSPLGARVVVVSSGLYKACTELAGPRQLMGEKHWDFETRNAYAMSKLFNCLYTVALDRMLKSKNLPINVYCMRPGFVRGTSLGRETHWVLRALAAPVIWFVSKNIQQGIDTILYLAETENSKLTSGRMYYDRQEEDYGPMVDDVNVRKTWATFRQIEEVVLQRDKTLTPEDVVEAQRLRELLPDDVPAQDAI